MGEVANETWSLTGVSDDDDRFLGNFSRGDFANADDDCGSQSIEEVFFYFCVTVVVIGVVGDSAGVIALLWSRSRFASSLNIYLITIFISDLGFLICVSLQLAKVSNEDDFGGMSVSCEFSVYVANVLSFISQWSMCAISAERFLAVCYPMNMKFKNLSTVYTAVNLMLTVTVVGLALEIWVFFVVRTAANGHCDSLPSFELFELFNTIDSFLSYAVPGCLIVFFTGSIFRTLRRRVSTFRELDPAAIGVSRPDDARPRQHFETVVVISRNASQRLRRRERRAVWFLMLVLLADTVLNTPSYAVRLYNTFRSINGEDAHDCLVYEPVQMVSYMLYYSQFSLNIVYLMFCLHRRGVWRQFRQESTSDNGRKRSDSCVYRSRPDGSGQTSVRDGHSLCVSPPPPPPNSAAAADASSVANGEEGAQQKLCSRFLSPD